MSFVLTPTFAQKLVACERLAGYERFGYRFVENPTPNRNDGVLLHKRFRDAILSGKLDLPEDMQMIARSLKDDRFYIEWDVAYPIANTNYILSARPDVIRITKNHAVYFYDLKFSARELQGNRMAFWQRVFYQALLHKLWGDKREHKIYWLWFDFDGNLIAREEERVDRVIGEKAYDRIVRQLLPKLERFLKLESLEETAMTPNRSLCLKCPYAIYCSRDIEASRQKDSPGISPSL